MYKQTQFACIIKQARMQKKLKSAYVAHCCHISPSYYSQVERGNKLPSEEIQKAILSVLEISDLIDEHNSQVEKLASELLNNIYYADSVKAHLTYLKLKKLSPEKYLKYHLVQLAYFATFNKTNEANQEIKYLSTFINHFDNEEKNLYNLYYAILLRDQSDLEAALSILINIHSTDEHLEALIAYHLAIIYSKLYKPLLAHDNNAKAIELFRKHNNITRLTFAISHDAILYSQPQLYDLANEKYLQLLQLSQNLRGADKQIILLNATTNALNAKDYISARKFINRIRCLPREKYYDLYICIKCRYLYETKQIALLNKQVKNTDMGNFNSHYKCLIELLSTLTTKNDELISKEVAKAEMILQDADYDLTKYFYSLAIIHSKTSKKEIYYYKKLMELQFPGWVQK